MPVGLTQWTVEASNEGEVVFGSCDKVKKTLLGTDRNVLETLYIIGLRVFGQQYIFFNFPSVAAVYNNMIYIKNHARGDPRRCAFKN